ncbi:hypothetical protein DPEC_G00254180 [Dallia pectoralis]|uniref:Uncharacterized protein n=1 Tax=Dallia pectoralis TaxID=75939 RepID=A0ACC2FU92_DALPE|nr:hypothetical protein DPEC_G00254180 [Dallia pectoralis]
MRSQFSAVLAAVTLLVQLSPARKSGIRSLLLTQLHPVERGLQASTEKVLLRRVSVEHVSLLLVLLKLSERVSSATPPTDAEILSVSGVR